MPTKRTSKKSATTAEPMAESKSSLGETVRKIKFATPKSYTPILVILLVIAAFLVGILFMKVQYLEQNGSAPTAQTGTQQAAAAPTTAAKVNVGVGHLPPQGNKNAKVKIIEFADLRCPYCREFFQDTESQIIKNYVDTGKAVFYFRHYDFLGPASTVAANAAECANDQGKFWAMHDYLYKNQPDESDTSMYNTTDLTNIAGQLGMDTTKFSTCLSANADNNKVTQDFNDGQAAGVSGTPTFFINGTMLVGAQPYSAFQTAIDQALAGK